METSEGGGANILLYGPPGTGKSEFAKTLGARVKRGVHFIGAADKQASEPNRRERVAALMIATELGAAAGKMIVVVDEADDLFAGVDEDDAATRHGSKVFMNRLVEQTRAPTVLDHQQSRPPGTGGGAADESGGVFSPSRRRGAPKNYSSASQAALSIDLDAKTIGQLARLPAAPALIENAILSAARMPRFGRRGAANSGAAASRRWVLAKSRRRRRRSSSIPL